MFCIYLLIGWQCRESDINRLPQVYKCVETRWLWKLKPQDSDHFVLHANCFLQKNAKQNEFKVKRNPGCVSWSHPQTQIGTIKRKHTPSCFHFSSSAAAKQNSQTMKLTYLEKLLVPMTKTWLDLLVTLPLFFFFDQTRETVFYGLLHTSSELRSPLSLSSSTFHAEQIRHHT